MGQGMHSMWYEFSFFFCCEQMQKNLKTQVNFGFFKAATKWALTMQPLFKAFLCKCNLFKCKSFSELLSRLYKNLWNFSHWKILVP